tara:strand:+ start:1534 stop:3456 length:1923 start_codon:yes stop_codon:yes gene_type:complete
MNNPYSTFASGINNTVEANQFNPQALNREVAQDSKKAVFQQDLIKLISAEILNKQRADMENAVTLAANPPEGTVADREFGKLTQTTESDVAQRIAAVDQQKAVEKNKRLTALTKGRGGPQGINGLNNPIPAMAAGNRGGLVAAAMHRPPMNYTRGGLVSFNGEEGSVVEGGDEELVEVDNSVLEQMINFGMENPAIIPALGVAAWEVLKRTPLGRMGRALVPESALNWGKRYIENFRTITQRRSGQRGIGPLARQTGEGLLNVSKAGILLEGGREAFNTMGDDGSGTTEKKPKVDLGGQLEEQPPAGATEPKDYRTQEEIDAVQAEIDAAAEQGVRFQQDLTDLKSQATTDRATLKTSADRAYNLGLKRIGAEEQGIAGLKEAQTTARGDIKTAQTTAREDQQKVIDDIKEMAATARGGRRELFQDLLVGLSKVGQGRNITEGLAGSYETIVGREADRKETARGLDEKAIGERKGLSALTLKGATDLANLDLSNQRDLTTARNALNATIEDVSKATRDSDAQTIQLGMKINADTRDIIRLMGENKIKQAGAATRAIVSRIAATQRLLSTEVLKAQGDKFRVDALSGAVSGMSDVITAAKISETLTEEQLASIQNNITAIIGEINKAVGVQSEPAEPGPPE